MEPKITPQEGTTGGRGATNPKRIFLFSGKRKCGKDYVTDLLIERIGHEVAVIIKVSTPIKSRWAKEKGLDFQQLMGASEYKERYRREMILWSEALRDQDPGCFCREAVTATTAQEKVVWIVSDVRRRTDVSWFKENYGDVVRTVRVLASEEVRSERGYIFTEGVDDKPSECDLDAVTEWDWRIVNDGDKEKLEESMKLLVQDVKIVLSRV